MRKIKDELFGEARPAVEVFPARDRLIDAADVYHLWVFEKHFIMPFGIHPKEYVKAVNRGYSMTQGEMEALREYYNGREDDPAGGALSFDQ